ncbi:sensor histidine kinase [Candidatus Leptofilum sp.]|uniref:sensor histidine kinase n=1 Tax=Candidatus Leptofilum sp. TaxID=3241576 RepID=UPI003B5AC5EA
MSKINILLVDDHPQNLLALEAVLDNPEYNLVQARSGEEALRHLLKKEFVVILLDIQMPGLDGFQTAKLIREREKTQAIPIIFLTAAFKDTEYVSQGYALQAIDYILKPFDPEILKAKVAVLVELHMKTIQVTQQAELLRQSEHRLEKLVRDLKAVNEELEAFTYSVSHDLRAPLRAIQGFSQIITHRHKDSLNEDGLRYFNRIIEASELMSELIEDLLAYSRLGQQAVQFEPVPLQKLLAEVSGNLAERISELGADLKLPPADTLPIVRGNRTLLSRIFTNLLENALNYRRSDVPLRITVSCETKLDQVVIRVADNGIGIAPKFHDKIFSIFQRLHSQAEYPGTGIGLAIVKKSVDLLNGQVWVESLEGEGSTFCVQLPCVQ